MTTPIGIVDVQERSARRVRARPHDARDGRRRHPRSRRLGRRGDQHRHRLLRPPAGLARPPRAVRPRDPRDRRPPRRRAPHRRGRGAGPRIGVRGGARRSRGDPPLRRQRGAHGRVARDRASSTSAAGPTPCIDLPFRGERAGTLPLQLVDHALEAFARTAGATLHLSRHRPQRPPPGGGRVQGARPRAARRVRGGSAAIGRRLDQGLARVSVSVAVVDYGAGNLVSIEQALLAASARASVARRRPDDIGGADLLVVPGVGRRGPGDGAAPRGRFRRPDPRLDRRRPPVPRHLPRAPAAVRGQRRGRRPDARRAAGTRRSASPTRRRCPTSAGTRSTAPGHTRRSTASRTARTSTSSTPTSARLPAPPSTDATLATTEHGSAVRVARSPAAGCSASSSTPSDPAPTACGWSRTSSALRGPRRGAPPDAPPARDPLPRRRRRARGQGHPVPRPGRRGRPARARRALRGRGRRRARVPRHHRRARGPRDAARDRRADRAPGVHPAHGRRRRPQRRRDARRPARRRGQGQPQHARGRRSGADLGAVPPGSAARRWSSRSMPAGSRRTPPIRRASRWSSRAGASRPVSTPIAWARRAVELGAGELLVTSIDRDGTGSGFDTALLRAISGRVDVPVIASGGAAGPDDFVAAVRDGGADAVLAAGDLPPARVLDRPGQGGDGGGRAAGPRGRAGCGRVSGPVELAAGVDPAAVRWGADGLVAGVVQDAADGRVLMVGWLDAEALAATLATGEVHFHSRSRETLWRKGETSGQRPSSAVARARLRR